MVGLVLVVGVAGTAYAAPPQRVDPSDPDLGPNVTVFDPSMPTRDIQAVFDEIHAQQVDNEMGSDRDALLFLPGEYGTDDERCRGRSATTPRSWASVPRPAT